MGSRRRFEVTGKKVFRDNQEGIFYVLLNDGKTISVENNPETLANIAWHQSSLEHRKEFISKFFNGKYQEMVNKDWIDITNDMKDRIITYQAEKLK